MMRSAADLDTPNSGASCRNVSVLRAGRRGLHRLPLPRSGLRPTVRAVTVVRAPRPAFGDLVEHIALVRGHHGGLRPQQTPMTVLRRRPTTRSAFCKGVRRRYPSPLYTSAHTVQPERWERGWRKRLSVGRHLGLDGVVDCLTLSGDEAG